MNKSNDEHAIGTNPTITQLSTNDKYAYGVEREVMLTTKDNPHNYFTQFDEWRAFDVEKAHFTLEFLARVVKSSDELSEFDEHQAIEEAIDQIIEFDPLNIYVKVVNK